MSDYKLTQQDKEQLKLFDAVDTVTTIQCDYKGCMERQEIDGDAMEAAEEFWHDGWRVIRRVTLCPKHAPKPTPTTNKRKAK